MNKYTPGPWDLDEGDLATVYELETSEPVADCFTGRSKEETEANGRLIAAAPELLEALVLLLRQVDESGNGTASDFGWPKATQVARSAIAKAEGRG